MHLLSIRSWNYINNKVLKADGMRACGMCNNIIRRKNLHLTQSTVTLESKMVCESLCSLGPDCSGENTIPCVKSFALLSEVMSYLLCL